MRIELVQVRLSVEEKRELVMRARELGLSISEYVRRRLFKERG